MRFKSRTIVGTSKNLISSFKNLFFIPSLTLRASYPTIFRGCLMYVCVVFALAVMLLLAGCGCKEDKADSQKTLVAVAAVKRGVIEQSITLTGELKPVAYVQVSPKISGRLARLALEDGTAVEENTAVKKGQVLAVLEHGELKAQVERAKASVVAAEASLKQAGVDMEEKRRDSERMENLFQAGSATEKQRDTALTQYQLSLAAVQSCQARLDEAGAACRAVQAALDESFIRSPMDGVVGRKFVDEGDMVSPGNPIASVLPMDRLKFLLDIPQRYLSNVKQFQIELSVDAWPGRIFACQREKVYPEINSRTRTFTMEMSVSNPVEDDGSYVLRPGMYATARIVLGRKENAIVVPADSLIRLSGRYYTFIVEDGIARRREVVVGLWSGNNMEIKEGLKVDQQMVVNGQDKLTDNTPVAIIEPAQQGGIR